MKTSVKVRPFNGNSKTKAFVELTLDDVLVGKGMRLVDRAQPVSPMQHTSSNPAYNYS